MAGKYVPVTPLTRRRDRSAQAAKGPQSGSIDPFARDRSSSEANESKRTSVVGVSRLRRAGDQPPAGSLRRVHRQGSTAEAEAPSCPSKGNLGA